MRRPGRQYWWRTGYQWVPRHRSEEPARRPVPAQSAPRRAASVTGRSRPSAPGGSLTDRLAAQSPPSRRRRSAVTRPRQRRPFQFKSFSLFIALSTYWWVGACELWARRGRSRLRGDWAINRMGDKSLKSRRLLVRSGSGDPAGLEWLTSTAESQANDDGCAGVGCRIRGVASSSTCRAWWRRQRSKKRGRSDTLETNPSLWPRFRASPTGGGTHPARRPDTYRPSPRDCRMVASRAGVPSCEIPAGWCAASSTRMPTVGRRTSATRLSSPHRCGDSGAVLPLPRAGTSASPPTLGCGLSRGLDATSWRFDWLRWWPRGTRAPGPLSTYRPFNLSPRTHAASSGRAAPCPQLAVDLPRTRGFTLNVRPTTRNHPRPPQIPIRTRGVPTRLTDQRGGTSASTVREAEDSRAAARPRAQITSVVGSAPAQGTTDSTRADRW